jgi:hypothetical protein
MTEIKLLMEHVADELRDAHTYAKLALEYKASDPEMAELFYKLSGEEMTHMNLLHKDVIRHIEAYKRQKGEPPEGMKALYDYLHKRAICDAEEVGVLQGMYKK